VPIDQSRLEETIRLICQPGRGILAADESLKTIEKRFKSINLESTTENRRNYRDMLFSTKGLEEFISGTILFDESVDQLDDTGKTFTELLASKGITPIIKVDAGLVDHPNFLPQQMARGLDGLEKRLDAYTERGKGKIRAAKWRQVILVEQGNPPQEFIESTMDTMAQYAAICQSKGYVPILEPEILIEGTHSIDQCAAVSERTLKALYLFLERHRVSIPNTLLKTSMVLSGKGSGIIDSPEVVADATLAVFKKSVPSEVPGIVFLSGGQTPVQATENLNAIAKRAKGVPWYISFSYARALQDPALKLWKGEPTYVPSAQEALFLRAKMCSHAQQGTYDPSQDPASKMTTVPATIAA
jgi:fructose-bisphosphate aldolase class I